MTIHAVIPVHNRLSLTKSIVLCLRNQELSEDLNILVVNDGSSDGTTEWLSSQEDITVLTGDGSLFWGGAVDLALRYLEPKCEAKDWLLLMNNDTTVGNDFVQCLLNTALDNAPAAVGSVIRDESDQEKLLSIGAQVDPWCLLTNDILNNPNKTYTLNTAITVDALSGRGALFPVTALTTAGGMRPHIFPHYLADYEVSVRVKQHGWKLLVSPEASVFSSDDYGSNQKAQSWAEKLFSVRSPCYLPAIMAFWWEVSNWLQRLTLPLRLPLLLMFPRVRRAQK